MHVAIWNIESQIYCMIHLLQTTDLSMVYLLVGSCGGCETPSEWSSSILPCESISFLSQLQIWCLDKFILGYLSYTQAEPNKGTDFFIIFLIYLANLVMSKWKTTRLILSLFWASMAVWETKIRLYGIPGWTVQIIFIFRTIIILELWNLYRQKAQTTSRL